MSQTRTPDECKDELAQLDQAHLQNETARDSFIAVAHTALFAASIAFIGDVVKLEDASAAWAVKAAWILNAAGLVCLSISYPIVARYIHQRRQNVYNTQQPNCRICSVLNWAALATFPLSVLALLIFVIANVGGHHDHQTNQTTRNKAIQSRTGQRTAWHHASTKATKPADDPAAIASKTTISLNKAKEARATATKKDSPWKFACSEKDGHVSPMVCKSSNSPSVNVGKGAQ